MSTCDPPSASASMEMGDSEYVDDDFNVDILADLDLLEKMMGGLYGTSAPSIRQSDRIRDKVAKSASSNTMTDYKNNKPIDSRKIAKYAAALERIQKAAVASPTYVSQIDELFKYRLFRRTPPERTLPDSVYYFNTAMINCMNTGDDRGLSHLLHTHMDPQCTLGVYCFQSMMTPRALVKFLSFLNYIHPDRILRVSDVVTVKNRISTTVLLKFTDCRVLFNSAAFDDASLAPMISSRPELLKRRLCIAEEQYRQEIINLVESDEDMVVYGTMQFHLTFDPETKKITGFYISGGITSAHQAAVSIRQA